MRAVDEIITSLQNEPEMWTLNSFQLYRDGEVCLWVANGFFGLKIEGPRYLPLSFISRCCLWRAVKQWLNDTPLMGYALKEPTQ